MRRLRAFVFVMFGGGALLAATGSAQEMPKHPTAQVVPPDAEKANGLAPDGYGTANETVVKIHASAFRASCPGDTLYSFAGTGATYRSAGGPSCSLLASVQLPAGAVVTHVGFDGYDVDPVLEINWGLVFVGQSTADVTGDVAWVTTYTSAGAYNSTVAAFPPHTVSADNYYFAFVDLPKLGPDQRVKGMRIAYKLQVSPAPATATFGDVPTNHWAFQFIEALAASGITSGCAAGQYCPNNPVTRAEMAVFLSAALGLHWPN